jgi:hypothetical protein
MEKRLGICDRCRQEALLADDLCPTCLMVADVPDIPDPDEGEIQANTRKGLGRFGAVIPLVKLTRWHELQEKRAASWAKNLQRMKLDKARRYYEKTKAK